MPLPPKPKKEEDPAGFREYKRLQKAAYRAKVKAREAEAKATINKLAAEAVGGGAAAPKPKAPPSAVELLRQMRAAKAVAPDTTVVTSEGGAVAAPVLAAAPKPPAAPKEVDLRFYEWIWPGGDLYYTNDRGDLLTDHYWWLGRWSWASETVLDVEEPDFPTGIDMHPSPPDPVRGPPPSASETGAVSIPFHEMVALPTKFRKPGSL